MTTFRPLAIAVTISSLGLCHTIAAAELSSTRVTLVEPAGESAEALFDRVLETCWTSSAPQAPGVGLTVDLGQPALLHRVYMVTGLALQNMPRSLRLKLSDDGTAWTAVAELDNRLESVSDPDLRFNPVRGRYLRIECGEHGAGFPLSIAELHVYGFNAAQAAVTDTICMTRITPRLEPPCAQCETRGVGRRQGAGGV